MSVRHILGSSALLPALLACLSLPARRSVAQSTTSLQTDATVLQRHKLGMQVLTGFERFDEYLGNGGLRNIGFGFNADSITGAQINQIGFTQSATRTLTGNSALAVSAGSLVTTANSRIVTAPLIIQYGLTSRLTLGLVVPLVQTRTTFNAQLNPNAGVGNIGPNPLNPASWSTNLAVVNALRSSMSGLQKQLTTCQATPSGTGCSTLLAQQAAAQSLITATTPFADALAGMYGTGADAPGVSFVPVDGSTTQAAVVAGIQKLRDQYAAFGFSIVSGAPQGAAAQGANKTLQDVLRLANFDSLRSTDRSSIGDITVGATYQLANTFDDSLRPGPVYRVAVNGGWRIGTGEPANRNRLFDNGTGYGQPGVIVGAATDVRVTPRFMVTGVGSYTHQFGTVSVARVANTANAELPLVAPAVSEYSAGDVVSLNVVPRYRLGGLFSFDGLYALNHTAADSYSNPLLSAVNPLSIAGNPIAPFGYASATTQQFGFGFTYSTIFKDRNPGRIPFETSFRHTETFAASGGPAYKTFVDQIQLRVFFR